jgi:hypothetical protein
MIYGWTGVALRVEQEGRGRRAARAATCSAWRGVRRAVPGDRRVRGPARQLVPHRNVATAPTLGQGRGIPRWAHGDCCHGDERGIVLEGLASGDDPGVPPSDRLTAELIGRHARLHGRVVIASGCATRSAEMARAFLDTGCAAYIAPDGYPQSALLFLHRLYHELAVGAGLSAAAHAAIGQDDDSRLFRLWSPGSRLDGSVRGR